MVWLRIIVCSLIVFMLHPGFANADDSVSAQRQKALLKLKPGKLLRLSCHENDLVAGRVVQIGGGNLVLGVDRSCDSYVVPHRRALRQGPAYSAVANPVWQSVEQETVIPMDSVRELYVRSNAALTGAVVGGIVVGGVGLGIGIGLASMNDGTGDNTGEVVGFAAVASLLGAGVGALIGSAIHKWHLEFREPGYRWRPTQAGLHESRPMSLILTPNGSEQTIGFSIGFTL